MTDLKIAEWRLDGNSWMSEIRMYRAGKTIAWGQKIKAMGESTPQLPAEARWWPPDLEWMMRSGVKHDPDRFQPLLARRFQFVVDSPPPELDISGAPDPDVPWVESVLDAFMKEQDGPDGAERILLLRPEKNEWAIEPLRKSLEILKAIWPDAGNLFETLVHRVVFVAGQGLQSASDQSSMGAIFLGPRKSWGPIKFAELMVHESGHLHLDLKLSLASFLQNPEDLGTSPVKKSARPLRQILQAVFVLKRMCAFLEMARDFQEYQTEAEAGLQLYEPRLAAGIRSMKTEAEWTEAGAHLFQSLQR